MVGTFYREIFGRKGKASNEFESTQIKFVKILFLVNLCKAAASENTLNLQLRKSFFFKYTASSIYVSCHILNENLILVCCKRKSVILNSPLYIGCAILEMSKYYLFDLLYNRLKPALAPMPLTVNYVDTDSL